MNLCGRLTPERKKTAITRRRCLVLRQEIGRGLEEGGASGGRHVYGAVSAVGQMGHTVGYRWWGGRRRYALHNLMPCREQQMLGAVAVLLPPHGHD